MSSYSLFPKTCPLIGDIRSVANWTNCCSKYFYPLAKRIVGEDSLAEDALQNTWCKILQSFSSFRSERPTACYWVRIIVANSAKDIRRQRLRRREVALEESQEVADFARDAERQVLDQQMLRVLSDLVAGLPEPYRQVIELRLEQELSTSEPAERLDISQSNVATRLNRGLRLLKNRLESRKRRASIP